MKTPNPNQVCVVEWQPPGDVPIERQYAVWNTDYSIYGAGGHFSLPGGGQLGIPVDVIRWWGTHWIATETDGIACAGQD